MISDKKNCRSSPAEVFSGKGVLKICCNFTGEHPCRSAFLIQLQIKATLLKLHFGMGVSVNLLHIFRTSFPKNTSGGLLLKFILKVQS